jgi:hypothetical protein
MDYCTLLPYVCRAQSNSVYIQARKALYIACAVLVYIGIPVHAANDRINAESYRSIVDALQNQIQISPSAFPLEAKAGQD